MSKPQQIDIGTNVERKQSQENANQPTDIGKLVKLPDIIGLPPTFRGMGAGTTEERSFSPTENAAVDLPDWLNKSSKETAPDPPPVTYSWNKQGESPKNMDDIIRDSMPILELIPCVPTTKLGPQLYKLQSAMGGKGSNGEFIKQLEDLYKIQFSDRKARSIKICIQNSSLPVHDSFESTYTESLANEWAQNIGKHGRTLRELETMFGRDVKDIAGKVGDAAADSLPGATMMNLANKGLDAAAGMMGNTLSTSVVDSLRGTAGVALGNRIDFPRIWSDSTWSSSYTANVKLYNPHPGDPDMTLQHIVAPLITLLMFVVPYSSDGITFKSPWLCKFKVPGLYDIQAGFVSNVQVIKGGDENHIAFNQVPGIVDVKITFGTLFGSMVSGPYDKVRNTDRPTLHSYVQPMIQNPKQFMNDTQTDENGFSIHGPKWAYDGYYSEGSATYTRWEAPIFEAGDSTNTGEAFTPPSRQSFLGRVKQFAQDHASVIDFLTGGNA